MTTDGRLVFPVFGCEGVISNMSESNKIAVSAADSRTMSGYQVKGRAELLTDGLLADKWKESMQKMFGVDFKFKGIVEVIPDRVIITTPGKHNNEEIWGCFYNVSLEYKFSAGGNNNDKIKW